MNGTPASVTLVSGFPTGMPAACTELPVNPSNASGRAISADAPARDEIGIRILGPVEAEFAGQPIPLGGPRQRSVLAALSLGVGQVVSAERLAHAIWDGRPPPTARAQIHGSITRLRRCLPGLIRTKAHGYVLQAASREVDAAVFQRLTGQAQAAVRNRRPAEAAALLRAALALWRGDALDGVTGLDADAAELEGRRSAAVKDLFAAELQTGRHAQVVPDLYAYVTRWPLQEPLRGLLMLALYKGGREAEALTVYRDGCRVLSSYPGAQPGPELRRLATAIRAHDPGLGGASFALAPGRPT
jgi:DNA-binding SARP family transcriptional activator